MAKGKDTKAINVDIDAELHRKLKVRCAERGLTQTEAIEQALRQWMKVAAVAALALLVVACGGAEVPAPDAGTDAAPDAVTTTCTAGAWTDLPCTDLDVDCSTCPGFCTIATIDAKPAIGTCTTTN